MIKLLIINHIIDVNDVGDVHQMRWKNLYDVTIWDKVTPVLQ